MARCAVMVFLLLGLPEVHSDTLRLQLAAMLKRDARCKQGGNATQKVVVPTTQQDQAASHCVELCQGKPACISVCNDVRMMICPTTPVVVHTGDTSAVAAAAASAATAAVREAVKD